MVEQRAVVRFVDLAGQLHGARGEPDLVADHFLSARDLQVHPGARDAVAVVHAHVRKALGEVLDLLARLRAVIEFTGELLDERVAEHGAARPQEF
ncbi:hypothetical protein SDC9_170477 [bioreactor metagenome]|uniref:Uncharacterized protein n=1 Tax=bioreactor metagenome TaxID=1076179 RepID=A0A645GAU0_9ZZZZ